LWLLSGARLRPSFIVGMMMDDDAPLSALAKPMKLDDDTPLASLADLGKPKASPKATKGGSSPAGKAPKASPKPGAGKAAAKAQGTPTKRKAQESSSSSSSESDESSGSSDEKPKASAKKGAPQGGASKNQKRKLLQQQKDADEDFADDGGGAVSKRTREPKHQVIADLLCRWWYVLPDWPPEDDAFYQTELAKRNLRKVSIQEWEWVPEVDDKGRKKTYELRQFRGLFRASDGTLIDLRPKDTCPCYANFMKKELPELCDMLAVAYENQIKELKNSKYNETALEAELKVKLTSARNQADKARQLNGGLKRRKSG